MQIQAFCKQRPYVDKERMSLLTKTILVMKLSAVLILVASLHVAARSTAQKVTYFGKDVELTTILSVIREQTGYVFFYDKKDLKDIEPISVSLKDVPVEAALRSILLGLPLEFELQGNTVFITRKMGYLRDDTREGPAPEAAPQDTIRGYVRDSTGAPLQGASVVIKGTKDGATTDFRGGFGLIRAKAGTVVVVSYTGYISKEIIISSSTHNLFVMLQRSQSVLDETVVQAYGTTSRRFNVGSISTVDAETIEKQPVTNVLLALEGQVPGLTVNQMNGVPGSAVLMQVRGQNTLTSNSVSPGNLVGQKPYDQPLFIIDGVPFAPQNNNLSQLNTFATAGNFGGGINQAGGISPFDNINPNDIESISILKDADATSIYGTQGSNGVVLITTKKGKPGKTVFNLMATTGYNTAERGVKLLNTPQYLGLRNAAFAADGVAPSNDPNNYNAYAPDLLLFDSTKYTNWEHVIYGKTSNNTDIHGTLSGGTYNNTFLIAGGFTRSDFNYPGNFSDQRLTMHSAFHHVSQDNRLTIDFGTDYGYDQNNSPGGGGGRILLPPNTPDLLDKQGNLLWSYNGVSLDNYQFYNFLKQTDLLQNYNLNTTMHITYKILTGLSISANLGYNRNTTSEHSIFPASSQDPLYASISASFFTNNFETINVEPQLDYTTTIGKGVLTSLVGATYKKNTSYNDVVTGFGYANDDFLGSINGAPIVQAYDNSTIYKYDAAFARIKYVYDRKYILSLNGNRDGSSNFGPGRRFGNFGAVAAGWIFTEEHFFKKAIPFMSYGKLSGSYGTSGSDGIAGYNYQAFWRTPYSTPPFQGIQPDAPLNLYNPDYSWALKKSLNTALDLGMFHDRVLLNATYYRDREGNQLGGNLLPGQTGFSQVLANLPAKTQNSGWEFSVTSNQIKMKNFSWSTTFNITFNRNKLLAFPNLVGSSYAYQYVLGKPVSEVIGYKYAGLDPQSGLFTYLTSKGQVTNTPNYELASLGGDQVPIADREVKYMGGFGNTFSYRHISLYLFFQFSSQEAPNYMSEIYSSYTPGIAIANQPVQVLNYWKNPGDHATFQKLTTNYGTTTALAEQNFSSSSGAYSNDTYARLKTMALSYSFPDAFLKKAHIQGARIYINAQNLLTITNYKVADPETFGNFTSMPIQRTIVCGLNFNF
jgi:TonB-dependent starch-binding outer membrane protein SusC